MVCCGLMAVTSAPHAQERESLEQLRQTTAKLIQSLVDKGVLTKEQATEMLQNPQTTGGATSEAATTAPGNSEQRISVPYIPQPVKDQIRASVKEEVLAQARAERWGVPNSVAEWTDRIKIDGDVRFRYQGDKMGKNNSAPSDYYLAATDSSAGGSMTRAADFLAQNSSGQPTANTTHDRQLWRTRFRLGVTAKVSEMVSAGARLTTGSDKDRVSTNQSLGQNFNKYAVFLDRAFVRVEPVDGVAFSAGRIANPWFSTDLIWSENLNFEGMALSAKWPTDNNDIVLPFATLGYFPIRADAPPKVKRALTGVQAGLQLNLSSINRVKLGVAQYRYQNMEGRIDQDYSLANGAGPTYGQYEYEAGLRQRGNTLFLTNSLLDSSVTVNNAFWGLASKFSPLAVTAAVELGQFNPFFVLLSAEYVKNTAYDRNEILRRTGITLTNGRADGYLIRAVLGSKEVRFARDWQVSLTYRQAGSDALLDAFTDSDPGMGGTNNKAYTVGASVGLDKNTALGVRYISSQALDSPLVQTSSGAGKFNVNTLQVDLNARF